MNEDKVLSRGTEEILTNYQNEMSGAIPSNSQELSAIREKNNGQIIRLSNEGIINTDGISANELEVYRRIGNNLKINDLTTVVSFGSDLQKKMNDDSKSLLATSCKSKLGEETMVLLNDLMEEVGSIDIGELSQPSKFIEFLRKVPFLRHLVSSVESIVKKHQTIEDNLQEIDEKIDIASKIAKRDNTELEILFNNNEDYIHQLENLVIAAKIKSNETEVLLNEMRRDRNKYTDYQIADVEYFKNRLDKRITDMIMWRQVFVQSLNQIRILQHGNIAITTNAYDVVTNTMPTLRNQLGMAIRIYNQHQSSKLLKSVTDASNKIIRSNAEKLKRNAIEITKMSEETTISIETIKTVQSQIKETLIQTQKIMDDSRIKRANIEKEILKMSEENSSLIVGDGSHLNTNKITAKELTNNYGD